MAARTIDDFADDIVTAFGAASASLTAVSDPFAPPAPGQARRALNLDFLKNTTVIPNPAFLLTFSRWRFERRAEQNESGTSKRCEYLWTGYLFAENFNAFGDGDAGAIAILEELYQGTEGLEITTGHGPSRLEWVDAFLAGNDQNSIIYQVELSNFGVRII